MVLIKNLPTWRVRYLRLDVPVYFKSQARRQALLFIFFWLSVVAMESVCLESFCVSIVVFKL